MRDTPSPSLGISGRMAALFQRHALTPLLALVAVLLGVFAVLVTPREEEPQINVTMANVMLAFPGASSQDGQQQVAVPVERWLRQMQGVEHTASVSRPGLVMVSVQFKVGVSRNDALVRLSEVMDAHKADFPPQMGVMPPVIVPKGIEDVPVLGITLWSRDKRPAGELEQVARSLEAELQRVPGTRDIRTLGGPGRQVTVAVDPSRLRERNIDLSSLQATLAAAQSVSQSGQVIAPAAAGHARPQMITVETGEFLRSAEQLGQVVVGQHGGRPVFLSEVAQVMDAPQQVQQYVWHTPGAGAPVLAGASAPQAGQVFPAVTLSVAKKAGENAVDVAQAARQRLEQLRGKLIPEGIEVSVTRDYGVTAAEKANKLIQKLLFATGSVILLVGWALGRREAIIVGVAVMLTLTATLFASWAWGFTLNRVSLFALIFSIGILVDDAIVVVENIHRHLAMDVSAKGHVAGGDVSRSQNLPEGMAHGHVAGGDVSRSQNSADAHEPLRQRLARIIPVAVDEVGGPTILATFTVIAALLPMAFVTGLMGPYMSPIPINASMGMAISLAIAFTVTPWLALKLTRTG
ncbi:MAG: efflux RND transporter permease subunit, partial [Burkholderiaceae bacterium]